MNWKVKVYVNGVLDSCEVFEERYSKLFINRTKARAMRCYRFYSQNRYAEIGTLIHLIKCYKDGTEFIEMTHIR